jgi:hypothetical protein
VYCNSAPILKLCIAAHSPNVATIWLWGLSRKSTGWPKTPPADAQVRHSVLREAGEAAASRRQGSTTPRAQGRRARAMIPTIRVGLPGYSGLWVAGATTVVVRQRNQFKGNVSARLRLCTGETVVRTRRVRAARGPVVTASSPSHPARIRNARQSGAASRSTSVSKHQGWANLSGEST